MKSFIVSVAGSALLALGCTQGDSKSIPAQVPQSKAAKSEAIAAAPKEGSEVVAANTGGVAAAAKAGGWGTIKGQVVFDGDLPKQGNLNVDKDQHHCLSKGPIPAEEWVVNPTNKGLRWVVVWLRFEPKKPHPIHESLKTPKGDAELDQPLCAFIPHVLAMRADQKLVIKNPAPVTHTATLKGFKNDFNAVLPAMENKSYDVFAENNPVQISCAIHPWMKGYAWIFEHPYFAVTDADGKFEIKLAPSGPQRLVIWQESIGYLGGAAGRAGQAIEIKPDDTTDVGVFKIKPDTK